MIQINRFRVLSVASRMLIGKMLINWNRPMAAAPEPRSMGLLDSARGLLGGVTDDKIQIDLSGDEYQKIDDRTASRMLGYFTQKLQSIGFPWRVYDAENVNGALKMKEQISELEAMDALKESKPIFLQPMRNLQLDLSPDSVAGLAAVGTLGGASMDQVTKMAAFQKSAKVAPGNQGFELKHGAPVPVSSYAELKLLYQMYNPEEKIDEKKSPAISKAAHQLSYFTTKTMATQHPWRFYRETDDNKVGRVMKAVLKAGVSGAVVGIGVGAIIGGPIGFFTGTWSVLKIMATYGAAIGGAYAGLDAGRVAAKGEPINVVEALERITQGKEVIFQETTMRSINVPIIGSIAWFSDHAKGSRIDSLEKLDRFYWMQDQDTKLPEEEKKEEPKPPALPGNGQGVTVVAMGDVRLEVGQVGAKIQYGNEIHVQRDEHEHDHVHRDTHVHLHGQ